MVEPLVFQPNEKAGGYMVNGDETAITYLVRQAVELGADIIKADPTDDVSIYHKVIEAASGIPVLVRGGGRVSDREILERTQGLLTRRLRHRLWPQRHSASKSERHHPCPDGHGA
jgi:DhnA family fructose-bisphosphate aldolase class Ia